MNYEKDNNNDLISACKNCGENLEYDWKVCPYCKTPVVATVCCCCGQEIKTNWNYCPHCKNKVKAEIKDKLRIDECNAWLRAVLK